MIKAKHLIFVVSVFLIFQCFLPHTSYGINITVNNNLGDLDGSGDGNDEDGVVQACADCWEARITTNRNFTVTLNPVDLTGGTTGSGGHNSIDGNNRPDTGTISIDNSNRTWYVDPNPQDTLEFDPDPANQWRFINGPAGSGLYNTVLHEIGHTLGWICGTAACGRNPDNPNYDGLMVPIPGSFVNGTTVRLVNGLVYNVPLRGDGIGDAINELSHPGINFDMMQGFSSAGIRETHSVIDVNVYLNTY
ncbi:MAG: hypothetical protein ACYST3_08115, partial [Planctomycetota bacterium]